MQEKTLQIFIFDEVGVNSPARKKKTPKVIRNFVISREIPLNITVAEAYRILSRPPTVNNFQFINNFIASYSY